MHLTLFPLHPVKVRFIQQKARWSEGFIPFDNKFPLLSRLTFYIAVVSLNMPPLDHLYQSSWWTLFMMKAICLFSLPSSNIFDVYLESAALLYELVWACMAFCITFFPAFRCLNSTISALIIGQVKLNRTEIWHWLVGKKASYDRAEFKVTELFGGQRWTWVLENVFFLLLKALSQRFFERTFSNKRLQIQIGCCIVCIMDDVFFTACSLRAALTGTEMCWSESWAWTTRTSSTCQSSSS